MYFRLIFQKKNSMNNELTATPVIIKIYSKTSLFKLFLDCCHGIMIGTLLAEKGRTICFIDLSKLLSRPFPIAIFIYPIPNATFPIAPYPIRWEVYPIQVLYCTNFSIFYKWFLKFLYFYSTLTWKMCYQ